VICQEKYQDWLRPWLRKKGIPDQGAGSIRVEHYNAISGLDQFRDVRLEILIGRIIPGPQVVEEYAGALSGVAPQQLPHGEWYRQVVRGIRLPDGSGIAVQCDEHPDPFCEKIRFQLCEAEMIQALGRARGINRTADDPLDIDIVADVCLPITVNEVFHWATQEPSALFEAAVDGAVLLSRTDMMKAYEGKAIWENVAAAKRTFAELRQERIQAAFRKLVAGWQAVTYQMPGSRQKLRYGYFDRVLIPDPRAWLEARLGPVASYVEAGPPFGESLIDE
jgi:putative DNA primase/helicase